SDYQLSGVRSHYLHARGSRALSVLSEVSHHPLAVLTDLRSDVDSQHLVQQQRSEASAKAKEGFFKALAQRNQLVEYDRTSAQRTMVYGATCNLFIIIIIIIIINRIKLNDA